jgi:hypothetical protein
MIGKKITLVLILLVVFSQISLTRVFAEETNASETAATPTNYDLTYPGILPDNPLYFFKMAKDNLLSFFIGKPLEKTSFILMQSDKQISASKLLINQHKDPSLSHETTVNAQKYFDTAIETTLDAKKQGYDTHEIVGELQADSKKQHQIIDEINSNLSTDDRKQFVDVSKKADELVQTTAALKP